MVYFTSHLQNSTDPLRTKLLLLFTDDIVFSTNHGPVASNKFVTNHVAIVMKRNRLQSLSYRQTLPCNKKLPSFIFFPGKCHLVKLRRPSFNKGFTQMNTVTNELLLILQSVTQRPPKQTPRRLGTPSAPH